MIEEPKSLAIAKRIYEEANIEREFITTLNKLYFSVKELPEIIGNSGEKIEFIVADHLFDSMFFESEVTAYLMASDPELAEWNRKFHLSYLEDEMKYFLATEEFTDGDNSVIFHWVRKAKTINGIQNLYEKDNENYKFHTAHEIPKAHFDILAKYLTVI